MSHVFTSRYDDVEIPDVGIHDFVLAGAGDHPDRLAAVDGPSGRSYTYGQLAGMIRAFAGGLAGRGFGKGDVLAVIAPNIPEYAVVFLGTTMAGGTVTTVNPTYGAEEIAYQLRDAGASIAITIGMFLPAVRQAADEVGVSDVFTFDAVDGAEQFLGLFGEPLERSVEVNPATDVAVLPYSSGTTGMPKGVMLTHRNLVANLQQIKPGVDMGDDEVVIAVLPFFHIYGMQVLMNGILQHGGTLVTMPRFDLEQFLSLIAEHKVTRAFVVPPIVLALAKHPLVDNYDLSSLKQVVSGAAPLGADLAGAATQRIGTDVVQGYGLTETSPVTHLTPLGAPKPGTVGVLVPSLEMRIVDPATGEDQGPGGEGEIWVRGPNVMKGYLGRASETGEMLDDDGWLHTGDIGVVDDEGYLSITDRLKELIKFKGFQVPPAELEALLISHPKIADCAVIGVPDEDAGEIPRAYVVAAPGQDLTAEEVTAFTAEHLASYKQVREVEFIDEIPKSASGKILRRELRARV
ncbi:MAG TPA: 4-coumarate--CoA ligase family protein [Egibacteraceae bacterium]|nr:4-coumarate--CoA ligase family protein [Egibacteraceae bacterium]